MHRRRTGRRHAGGGAVMTSHVNSVWRTKPLTGTDGTRGTHLADARGQGSRIWLILDKQDASTNTLSTRRCCANSMPCSTGSRGQLEGGDLPFGQAFGLCRRRRPRANSRGIDGPRPRLAAAIDEANAVIDRLAALTLTDHRGGARLLRRRRAGTGAGLRFHRGARRRIAWAFPKCWSGCIRAWAAPRA